MPFLKKSIALRIALIYFAVGTIWIIASDTFLADRLSDNPPLLITYQTYKGWVFVLLTSVLIYWLISRQVRSQADVYNELAESESKFRTLVEQSLTGVYIIQDGKFVYVNPELGKILGYSVEELYELPVFLDVVHEDDRELVRSNIQKRITGEIEAIRYSFRCRKKDGQVIYVEVHGSRIEWEGKPAVIGTLLDVTDKFQALATLKEREQQLQLFIKYSPAAIAMFDREMHYLAVSDRWLSDYKLEDQDILGRSHYDIFPEIPEHWKEIHRRCLAGAIERCEEEPFQRADGHVDWVRWEIHPWIESTGEIGGIILFSELITERKLAQQKIRESEQRLRSILDTMFVFVGLIDLDGRIVEVNNAPIEAAGLKRGAVLGRTVPESYWFSYSPDVQERVREALSRAVQGETVRDDYIIRVAGDRRIVIDTTFAPLRNDTGQVIQIVGSAVDISKRKQAEEAMRESEERLRLALDAANMGTFDWDIPNNRITWSRWHEELWGYGPGEFDGTYEAFAQRVHPDDLQGVNAEVERCITRREPFRCEFRVVRPDDSMHWVLGRGRFTFDENGQPEHMRGVVVETTARKEAEKALYESKIRLEHLTTANPVVLYALNVEGEDLVSAWVSGSIMRILGYTGDEALKRNWWTAHLHVDDRERCLKNMETLLEKNRFVHEYRFARKDGHYIWVRDELRIMRDENRDPVEIIGTWSDISEEHKERERMRLFTTAFESTNDGVIITDLDANILSVNKAFEKITGYNSEEVQDKNPNILKSGRHDRSFYQSMWNSLEQLGFWQGEIWNRRKNGEIYPQLLSINKVRDETGQPSHYVGVFTDISKLKETESELEHLAHFDPLTGLPNRLLVHSRIEHAIERANRHNSKIAVLFIDLDDFKKINDSLGHIIGDELLKAMAKRLLNRIREEDTLGRLGGDEFVIILEDIGKSEDIGKVAHDIFDCLRRPFCLDSGYELYVECCIGISIYPIDGTNPTELLRDADTALYRAKELGRNNFSFFTAEMGEQAIENLQLETSLRNAIKNDELLLHYQPKVSLKTGQIVGAEALIRWQRNNELVPPFKFIPIAERTGLIAPIGEWVIHTTCKYLRHLLDQGLNVVEIGVNVSVQQFWHQELDAIVRDALEEYDINPRLLGVEITESALMEHPEEAMSRLQPISDMGVQIILDDFGTGFSNMAYLTRFPIDVLKIDTTFIKDIDTDPDAAKLVNSIIDLAKGLELNTVAEGVETENHLEFLRNHNCNEMQGYYFSKPVPAEEFETMLREGKSIEFVN